MGVVRAFAVCCFVGMVYSPAFGDEKPLVDSSELKLVRTLKPLEQPFPFAFSPDGRVLACSDGKRVRFWDPATGKKARDVWETEESKKKGGGDIFFLDFVDAKTLALLFAGGDAIQLWTYPDCKALAKLDLGKRPTSCFAVAPGLVAVGELGSAPCSVRLWTGPKWNEARQIEIPAAQPGTPPEVPKSLAFSSDRSELAVGTQQGFVHVYRVIDGKPLRSSTPGKLRVTQAKIAYSPDGRELAVASGWFNNTQVLPYGLGILDAELKEAHVKLRWDALQKESSAHAYHCFFSPDGKTLFVTCADKRIRFYEVATGRLRRIGQAEFTSRMTLSPDGRLLATRTKATGEWGLALLDWRAPTGKLPTLDAAALERLWFDLASADSEEGFQAVVALGSSPTQAAKLFSEKFKPVATPKADSVKAWIADLGSDNFTTREAAEKELAKLGSAIESELKEAAKSEIPERGDRANRLLKAASGRDNPERLRILRAIEVLEYINTSAGRDILKELASGAPSALLTRDAKAALERLKAFDPKP